MCICLTTNSFLFAFLIFQLFNQWHPLTIPSTDILRTKGDSLGFRAGAVTSTAFFVDSFFATSSLALDLILLISSSSPSSSASSLGGVSGIDSPSWVYIIIIFYFFSNGNLCFFPTPLLLSPLVLFLRGMVSSSWCTFSTLGSTISLTPEDRDSSFLALFLLTKKREIVTFSFQNYFLQLTCSSFVSSWMRSKRHPSCYFCSSPRKSSWKYVLQIRIYFFFLTGAATRAWSNDRPVKRDFLFHSRIKGEGFFFKFPTLFFLEE